MSTVGHEPPSQADAVRAQLAGRPVTDAYQQAGVPLPPPPPQPQPHPAVTMPAVPSLRSKARRFRIAAIVMGVIAVVAIGIAVVAISSDRGSKTVSDPAAPVVEASPPLLSTAPDPAAAKETTCGVLRSGYESVANAIDERNRFNSTPWTDPAMLAATDELVGATGRLADQLEASLSSTTPSELRTAVVEYAAGLRALGISQRNHARDMQLNGVGALYNQVVEAPLRICGIAS